MISVSTSSWKTNHVTAGAEPFERARGQIPQDLHGGTYGALRDAQGQVPRGPENQADHRVILFLQRL